MNTNKSFSFLCIVLALCAVICTAAFSANKLNQLANPKNDDSKIITVTKSTDNNNYVHFIDTEQKKITTYKIYNSSGRCEKIISNIQIRYTND
jgi:hypothetical protein